MLRAIDLLCANCEHPPSAHYAYKGFCHRCNPEKCCPYWQPKTKEAREVAEHSIGDVATCTFPTTPPAKEGDGR